MEPVKTNESKSKAIVINKPETANPKLVVSGKKVAGDICRHGDRD